MSCNAVFRKALANSGSLKDRMTDCWSCLKVGRKGLALIPLCLSVFGGGYLEKRCGLPVGLDSWGLSAGVTSCSWGEEGRCHNHLAGI